MVGLKYKFDRNCSTQTQYSCGTMCDHTCKNEVIRYCLKVASHSLASYLQLSLATQMLNTLNLNVSQARQVAIEG